MTTAKKLKTNALPPFKANYARNDLRPLKYFTKYLKDENKPIHQLKDAYNNHLPDPSKKTERIVHLLGRDLRLTDNLSLDLANRHAKKMGAELVLVYPVCSDLWRRHDQISPFRHAYIQNILGLLKESLAKCNVPLVLLPVEKADDLVPTLSSFFLKHKVGSVYATVEYEVDELRMLEKLCKSEDFDLHLQHQTCVVRPGELHTKSNDHQYSVFSPWYRAWAAHIGDNPDLLEEHDVSDLGSGNSKDAMETFKEDLIEVEQYPFPGPSLDSDRQKHFDETYRLKSLDQPIADFEKSYRNLLPDYKEIRNDLAADDTSHLSHHFAMGVISSRQVINAVLRLLKTKSIKTAPSTGADEFIRQVSWRDFYRHVMANWPHICMHRPFQLDYSEVEWEYLQSNFDNWCSGHTGFPIVDALMRQLLATGYMSNRSRMIVGSFLSKNLLLDWRLGERFFAQHLVDCDFASNNCGWGFCSSVGVDPQPYFRVFNPQLQSERFDKSGEFIKRWVPELRDIKTAKQIHLPYLYVESAKVAKANSYPEPIVDYKLTREMAIERFKDAKN